MNQAAQAAREPWLLFLHADSLFSYAQQLSDALRRLQQLPPNSAGHFGLRFSDTVGVSPRLIRHMQRKSRCNRPETINGDQGLLLRREFFQQLGGFDTTWAFLEDQAISAEIFAHGQWQLLPGDLISSARRFQQEGAGQRYFVMMLIMCARRAGLDQFFQQAPGLYPTQDKTHQLQVAPFLELMLKLAEQHPGFWLCMADYCLENAWQFSFLLDGLLAPSQQPLLQLHDAVFAKLPLRLTRQLLAPLLEAFFRGPGLAYLRARDTP